MKFEIFSRIRKLDVDMIWDHNRYVKADPLYTSTIMPIFDDLGRKAGNLSASKEIRYKKWIDAFLQNIKNPCLDPKYRSEIIWNRRNKSEIYVCEMLVGMAISKK